MGHKSHVVRASPRSESLRTTIPKDVVRELGIKLGDVLDWEIEGGDGKKIARVRKLE